MEKTITKVFVKETYSTTPGSSSQTLNFEFGPTGTIPGLLVEFIDGDKILMIAPDAPTFSFRHNVVNFRIEDYAWNEKLKRWDRTETRSFDNNIGMVVDNYHLVDPATGADRETFFIIEDDLTRPILDPMGQTTGTYHKKETLKDPLVNPSFVGEFTFWMNQIGKTVLVPPIQSTMEEYFLKKFVDTTPDPVVTDPAPAP